MSRFLYRSLVLMGAVTWMLVGMSLSRVLVAFDAGTAVALNDVLLLALMVITGVLDAVALLGLRVDERRDAEDAPAA